MSTRSLDDINKESNIQMTSSAIELKRQDSQDEKNDEVVMKKPPKSPSAPTVLPKKKPKRLRQEDCNFLYWRKFRYYFRHPYARIWVMFIVLYLDLIIYAQGT